MVHGCDDLRDEYILGLAVAVLLTVAYGVYALTNPGADGAVFATVVAAITGVLSFVFGRSYGSQG